MNQDSLLFAIERSKANGFNAEFLYIEKMLLDRKTFKAYKAKDCTLVKHYRLEGMSDPADGSILFLIKCSDGVKGYISSAYGIYADEELIQFLQSLKKPNLQTSSSAS